MMTPYNTCEIVGQSFLKGLPNTLTHSKPVSPDKFAGHLRDTFGSAGFRGKLWVVRELAHYQVVSALQRGNRNAVRHGYARTKLYRVWAAMLDRCRRESCPRYPDYGGRGITVCERWERFDGFLADMGDPPRGLTLERINVNGNYEPLNCKWATTKEQGRNRRNNRMVEHGGRNLTIGEWAEVTGLRAGVIWVRIQRHGWDVKRALETPPRPRRARKTGRRP